MQDLKPITAKEYGDLMEFVLTMLLAPSTIPEDKGVEFVSEMLPRMLADLASLQAALPNPTDLELLADMIGRHEIMELQKHVVPKLRTWARAIKRVRWS